MRLVVDLQGAQGASRNRGIGRYSRELAMAMARTPREHEVVIALNGTLTDSAYDLAGRFSGVLPRENVKTWFSPNPAEPNRYAGKAVEIVRAQFLASLNPDLVHVASVFEGLGEPNITGSPAGLERLPLAATFYDLIPFIRRKQYLSETGAIGPHGWWYYTRLQEMFLMDGLLAISESSRNEAIDHLGVDPGKVWNIQAGVHADFAPFDLSEAEHRVLRTRYGLEGPFILFVGAGDVRKNEASLIDAYVRLPEALRARYQLLIVGHVPQQPLRQRLEGTGCPPNRLVIVPFVEEGDLARLYAACELFVFPSLHEGFGLPAAEAMACGAPVIASNTSSLPEVVGLPEALFDPSNPLEIAARMTQFLENPGFRAQLVEHGLERAKLFTWDACAARAWDALEGTLDRLNLSKRRSASILARKPSLAFVSPLPPQPSGISDYSRAILPALSRYYDITLVSENGTTDDAWLTAAFPIIDAQAFREQAGRFERTLYQVGSSPFHSFQYRDLLPECPGVTVLHDAFLSLVWHWHAFHEGKTDEFFSELYISHGYPALKYATTNGLDAAANAYPACLSVLDQSLSIIQHSQHGLDLLAHHFGERVRERVSIVPLLAQARYRPGREDARRKLGLTLDELVICSFGMIAPTKLSTRVFEAWERVPGEKGRLVYVGALATADALLWPIEDLPPSVHVTGRSDQEIYDLWLAAADIAVQLRTSSRGETSAAITDCLSVGLPLIVNAHGSAAELPKDIVVKLPDHFETDELRDAIVALRDDPARRQALGQAGRLHARERLGAESIAERYRDVIERTYRPDGPAFQLGLSDSLARLAKDQSRDEDLRLEAVVASAQATFADRAPRPERLLVGVGRQTPNASREDDLSFDRLRPWLLTAQGGQWRCEAVRFEEGSLLNAYAVGTALAGCRPLAFADDPIDFGGNDILLLFEPDLPLSSEDLAHLKQRILVGLRIVVALDAVAGLGDSTLRDVLGIADRVLCSSREGADRLVEWLSEENLVRHHPLAIDIVRLGSGFDGSPVAERPDDAATLAATVCAARRTTFLTAGTDGLEQVLTAFRALWEEGAKVALVVIGAEETSRAVGSASELGTKLHFVNAGNSRALQRLYGLAACLLAAGDGITLSASLNEAVRAGLPVIARDTPLYREVAGQDAVYFAGTAPGDLKQAVLGWLGKTKMGPDDRDGSPATPGWDESANRLIACIFADEVHMLWPETE